MDSQKPKQFDNWLRKSGTVGNFVANTISFLTASWGLVLSAVLAVASTLWAKSYEIVQRHDVQTAAWVFFLLFWTYIGFVVLSERKKPREVRPFHDYRYGLTFEGIIPHVQLNIQEAALAFSIALRNFSSGPIKYDIETFRIVINNRTLPEVKKGTFASFMPRGGGRIARNHPFSLNDIKDFIGKLVTGKIELEIVYGHPERPPERRLKMTFDLNLELKTEGPSGYSDTITSESDLPI